MAQSEGDLARVKAIEPSTEWPTAIEITAFWSRGPGRRGKRRSIQIDAAQFFGTGQYGAPMSGEQLIGMVDKLRRQGPDGYRLHGDAARFKPQR